MPRLFTALELSRRGGGRARADARRAVRRALDRARKLSRHACASSATSTRGPPTRSPTRLTRSARAPSPVAFEGLSWFGGDKPRAIVAKVKPAPALVELQADHERRLRRLGLPPETRNFTPHVTLARLRGVGARGGRRLSRRARRAGGAGLRGGRFVLMSARDGVGGGPYVVEAGFLLG